MQRFLTIMSVFFFVCGVVSFWRTLSDHTRDRWLVQLVLSGAAGVLAARGPQAVRNERTKRTRAADQSC